MRNLLYQKKKEERKNKKKGQQLVTSEMDNREKQTNPTFDRVQFVNINY